MKIKSLENGGDRYRYSASMRSDSLGYFLWQLFGKSYAGKEKGNYRQPDVCGGKGNIGQSD